jgi:two-component sensor histidine kinase
LHFTWTEKGGPAVKAPTRRSFGTRLIETLGNQLSGTVEMTYDPNGFIYALDIPLSSLKAPE